MELLFVGLGGVFGAAVRYKLGELISKRTANGFPFGTFIINISGAVLLGYVTSINPSANIYLFAGDGFLGAYTTFSTFMYEGFHLFRAKKGLNAVVYIAGTFILGVAGYLLGTKIGIWLKTI